MTSTTTRIITVALAILALAVPAASAMPIRDNTGVQTPSLAWTSSAPRQDLRNADNRAAGVKPTHDQRNADKGVPAQQPQTMNPVVIETRPTPIKDDGPSPLLFILPSLALIGMLAAATVYVRSSRQPART
jgi:hypothetical protein